MFIKTERQQAEKEFNSIKQCVQSSLLNYRIRESPFSAVFEIKKQFLNDYSPTFENPTASSPLTSSPVQCARFHDESSENDSGRGIDTISKQCTTC